jgi:predicted transcriptional regulator
MLNFENSLEIIGSPTRLRLLELIAERPRTIRELASSLAVTQQAVMKHLTILEKVEIVKQVKLDAKAKVKSVYTPSVPLSLNYVFKNGILCMYIGSSEAKGERASRLEALKPFPYRRKMLRLRAKVAMNRVRTLVEEDLNIQAGIRETIDKMGLSTVQAIALHCSLMMGSESIPMMSKMLGLELQPVVEEILGSQD